MQKEVKKFYFAYFGKIRTLLRTKNPAALVSTVLYRITSVSTVRPLRASDIPITVIGQKNKNIQQRGFASGHPPNY